MTKFDRIFRNPRNTVQFAVVARGGGTYAVTRWTAADDTVTTVRVFERDDSTLDPLLAAITFAREEAKRS